MTKTSKKSTPTTTPAIEEVRDTIMSEAKFKSTLLACTKSIKKQREVIQLLGETAIMRAYAFENYDYITQLFNGVEDCLSKSNATQLKVWLQTYSPVRYVKTKNGFVFRKDKNEEANPFDFEGAHSNKWYNVEMVSKEELKLSSVAFMKRVENLIKNAEKAIEKDNVETPEDEIEILKTLNMLKTIAQDNTSESVNVVDTVAEQEVLATA